MNRYKTLRVLGDGSFGTVLEAIYLETNEKVGCRLLTLGSHQENEEEVFLMGRMHRSSRSESNLLIGLL
jgi:hypothetical protein